MKRKRNREDNRTNERARQMAYQRILNELLTPPDEAMQLIQARRERPELFCKVAKYLGGDIPPHFCGPKPIRYLARHVATANQETLHFVQTYIEEHKQAPLVISQDSKDTFVAQNILKHNLGKLPIQVGQSRNQGAILQKMTIVDFNQCNGRKLADLTTCFGMPLMAFHRMLLEAHIPAEVAIVDEADWISRHHRGSLTQHYRHFLALFIVHGVMFEDYDPDEEAFVYDVLLPAFRSVEREFGVKPLICRLTPDSADAPRDWNTYPESVYPLVKACLDDEAAVKTYRRTTP